MARKVVGTIVFIALAGALLSVIVMFLWNKILVPTAGVNPIDLWQAAGLLVLSRILFGRMGPPSWKGRGRRGGPWRDKWKSMSEEERHELRQRWKDRCAPVKKDEKNPD